MLDLHNRRAFLRAAMAAGAAWATADLAQVEDALAWAHEQSAQPAGPHLSALTRAQADVIEAMTARILPAVNGRPGAAECGAIYFIDRALATFNATQKHMYGDGIADLNTRAQTKQSGVGSFAALAVDKQVELLRGIEQSQFFQAVRFDTIVGTFALPKWGGNKDYAGWHLIGFDHQPRFQPPFGFYDAEVNRQR